MSYKNMFDNHFQNEQNVASYQQAIDVTEMLSMLRPGLLKLRANTLVTGGLEDETRALTDLMHELDGAIKVFNDAVEILHERIETNAQTKVQST